MSIDAKNIGGGGGLKKKIFFWVLERPIFARGFKVFGGF